MSSTTPSSSSYILATPTQAVTQQLLASRHGLHLLQQAARISDDAADERERMNRLAADEYGISDFVAHAKAAAGAGARSLKQAPTASGQVVETVAAVDMMRRGCEAVGPERLLNGNIPDDGLVLGDLDATLQMMHAADVFDATREYRVRRRFAETPESPGDAALEDRYMEGAHVAAATWGLTMKPMAIRALALPASQVAMMRLVVDQRASQIAVVQAPATPSVDLAPIHPADGHPVAYATPQAVPVIAPPAPTAKRRGPVRG